MAYTQVTLDQLAIQIGTLLDDANESYWTRAEKYFAIYEALYVWGALTSYWRASGTFSLASNTPYYDLSVQLPTLRTRTWTLGQMVTDIQYMLLENPSGIAGTGMSGQISVTSILNAIVRARNRFVLDARIPLQVDSTNPSVPGGGLAAIPQDAVFVHRAMWQDGPSGVYTNLWRQDAWVMDGSNPVWTASTGAPIAYSESVVAPLALQLYPPPTNSGVLEIIDVQSLAIDTTNASALFNLPDEWVHAVLYATLSDLFNVESQLYDPLRYQYAEMRYKQAASAVQEIRTILRLQVSGLPLRIDAFASLDAASPYWRNQAGAPYLAGVMHDFLAFAPVPNSVLSCAANVVQAAPIPASGATNMPMGYEDLDNIVQYATHKLTFKCGGNEFKSTFAVYDQFMSNVARRGAINKAKIQYLTPLFGQPQREDAERPDAQPVRGGG